jgi:cyclopropane-fatty-acyl-phospholipid synthase
MSEASEFWAHRSSSGHRFADEQYFAHKALEHAALMSDADREAGCVDLGCGAGELLVYFARHAKVDAALDYSPSMMAKAADRLAGSGIALSSADIFAYLPSCRHEVWVSSQAVNQYLTPSELERFLDLFWRHERARALYLFDCVDPARYALLPFGVSYCGRAEPIAAASWNLALRRRIRLTGRRLRVAAALARGLLVRTAQRVSTGMGYGYLPAFWLRAALRRGLTLEIVSSRYYEYRYHVVMRKTSPS